MLLYFSAMYIPLFVRSLILVSLFFIANFLFLQNKAYADRPVVTVSMNEWTPISSKSLPFYGVGPRIISEAFSHVGYDVEYVWRPWVRAMFEAEKGRVDLTGLWAYSDSRADKFIYSRPFISSSNVFLYRKQSPFDWDTISNFPNDVVVGVTRGYSYGKEFNDAIKSGAVRVDVAGTDELNVRKLLVGRINAFIGNELVLSQILKNSFSEEESSRIAFHSKPVAVNLLHMLASKNNQNSISLLHKFDEGLRYIKKTGRLNEIISEYQVSK